MAKNTLDGSRKGQVCNRSQIQNPKTGQFIKRGPDGKFMASKDTPFKGVRKENIIKPKTKIVN